MHLLGLIAGLAHATVLAVIGFFVLFAAGKSTGIVKRLGEILGVWLYVVAVLAIVAGVIWGPLAGGMGHHRFYPWMHQPSGQQVPAASNAAAK